jgi:hypothetical protein
VRLAVLARLSDRRGILFAAAEASSSLITSRSTNASQCGFDSPLWTIVAVANTSIAFFLFSEFCLLHSALAISPH